MSLLLLLNGHNGGGAPAPTYATLNPADKSAGITLSGGDLIATAASGGWQSARGTIALSSGTGQFEAVMSSAAPYMLFGIMTASGSLASYVGGDAYGFGYFNNVGELMNGGAAITASGNPFGQNDVITIAYNAATGVLNVTENGVARITNHNTGLAGQEVFPAVALYGAGDIATLNFGQTALQHPIAAHNEYWGTP